MSVTHDLWLRVESDDYSVSCPRRYRRKIRLYPADRLVSIDQEVLRWGVFAGAAQACQLRLELLPMLFPQFGIRFDSSLQWRLMGFNGEVFHNGIELLDRTVTLQIDDTIICDPYLLRVVSCPDELLQELVEQMASPPSSEPEFTDGETDFLLNVR